jgi:hypothetical protein
MMVGGYMALADLAVERGIPLRRVQKAAAQLRLVGAKLVVGRWFVRESDFDRWLNQGKHTPGPAKGTKRQERHAHGGSDGD